MNQKIQTLIKRLSLIEPEAEDEDDARLEAEDEAFFEADGKFWIRKPPRPPAKFTDIESCALQAGVVLPKAYQEFLMLSDGWKDLQNHVTLLGTSDYKSLETQRELGELAWAQLRRLNAPVRDIPPELLSPKRLRPLLTGQVDSPPGVEALLKFIREYPETQKVRLVARSTIFGLANAKVFCFRGDEVLEDDAQGGIVQQFPDSWSWLNFYAEYRIWRSDEY